ncbi:MAG TPA: hypothetical protein VF185_04245 [Patescibacteria group bacterium]
MIKLFSLKKKSLLILVDNIGPKKEHFAKLLSEHIGKTAQVTLGKFDDIKIEIEGNKVNAYLGKVNLKSFDLVYFRRIDHSIFPLSHTLALFFDKFKIKYFDTTFREVGAGGDKVTSITRLALSGVSVPQTIFVTRTHMLEEADNIISKLGLPIIAKDTKAQGNTGIFVINTKNDFKKLLEKYKIRSTGYPVQFLLQAFIDIDKEFRLLVLKDKVAAAHKKHKRDYKTLVVGWVNPDDDELEFVNINSIPDVLKKEAVKAAKALNVEIAGVDGCLLKKSNKPVIIEVNRGPGFEYDAKKSPEVPEVANFLKKELSK